MNCTSNSQYATPSPLQMRPQVATTPGPAPRRTHKAHTYVPESKISRLSVSNALQQPCLNTNFAFNFESFTNTTDFTLQLEHLYEDPRTASGPVSSGGSSSGSVDDWNLVFGRVNITKHNLGCMTVATSDFECAQPLRSVIDAPYYAMV